LNKRPKTNIQISTAKVPFSAKVTFAEKFVKSAKLKYLQDKPISLPAASRMDALMRYTKTSADIVGSWSWGQVRRWDRDIWDGTIFPHVSSYKTKTWAEIESETSGRRRRNKAYDVSAICVEARRRLAEIQLEDLDEVFRFRIGALPRLYGFRIAEVFFILWWDPAHKICPVKKD
jgi:hypothetical protein